jgi:hypothetical protein
MKVNYRRKDKWVKTSKSTENDWYSESPKTAKVERREKHQHKNKRIHQYHHLRELFDDEII